MNNPLRYLLFAVFLALAALPGAGRANPGDYVSVHVPDLAQAVGFFHDVMNCDAIAASSAAKSASAAMLDCGDGVTVELIRRPGSATREPDITFATNDAVAAAAWLRANHVVVGPLLRSDDGAGNEKTVVAFVSPWGQPIKLVSHGSSDGALAGTRLAVQ